MLGDDKHDGCKSEKEMCSSILIFLSLVSNVLRPGQDQLNQLRALTIRSTGTQVPHSLDSVCHGPRSRRNGTL